MKSNKFQKDFVVILSLLLALITIVFSSLIVFADDDVDFNKDGKIDILDLVLMKKDISTKVNIISDDNFNSDDLICLIDVILGKRDKFEKSHDSGNDDMSGWGPLI